MNRIGVMQPWLGEEEVAAVTGVMEAGWGLLGPRVEEFENRFAERQEVGYAVATSSSTSALLLAMVVAGVAPGDDVVVPAYCSLATANAPTFAGARPVLADVDPVTGNITAADVEAAMTPRTTAVIAVDHGGTPVDLDPIRGLCEPMAIRVIEDAGSGVGAEYRGRPVGAGADLAVWSFQPHQVLTTGEGGMLTTDNVAWALRGRRLRERAAALPSATRSSVLAIAEVGFDYRMTDVQAAVGIVQLRRLDEVVRRRRDLAARYSAAIGTIAGLRPVSDPRPRCEQLPVLPGGGARRVPAGPRRAARRLRAGRHRRGARHHGGAPRAGLRRERRVGRAAAGGRGADPPHRGPAAVPPDVGRRPGTGGRGAAHGEPLRRARPLSLG
ncbi:DegT/DnrJ/EryC1/StrS family aminotransferase [Nocardioides sp. TF02-7]|uniref:DegT/DnrJ/EryC1/StrS family aminotransferase n=1 Tax=Nocardioides sp. TF02-7 TaxID=2917724 RepID=UPI001F06E80A|nr:DegT/DnrJ/EryC1/StrS family aminotransferase [Nocardioides sp. TF02-7]UMG91546.1 DegT/DnrJ/EryC1/StrS family aminotransferase [Nocardioides sp. TF02-7]